MSVLPIYTYGDPVLRREAKPVERINHELRTLLRDMAETMVYGKGIGLAAPQVGESLSLMVVDLSLGEEPNKAIALINPRILGKEGEQSREEGCLSIPDIHGDVIRAAEIGVRFHDLEGQERELECRDLLARVILHEVDHLQGRLFVDRLSPLKRRMLQGKLRKLAKERS
ncbi:MAG: peptide deformylase [Candidatus Latescibacteria bacterium]|nr:peptide deformylase [Candidatus Latescibacterota bacterium]MCK5528018.1 peptide deformylase [Candidatus Latescibacterota bacterium]MCK5734749.1 peptide deformylase [Candidatus Latescibacterota bacterium]